MSLYDTIVFEQIGLLYAVTFVHYLFTDEQLVLSVSWCIAL